MRMPLLACSFIKTRRLRRRAEQGKCTRLTGSLLSYEDITTSKPQSLHAEEHALRYQGSGAKEARFSCHCRFTFLHQRGSATNVTRVLGALAAAPLESEVAGRATRKAPPHSFADRQVIAEAKRRGERH